MARYVDKVVIVTGGSKGIGEGCVRVFVDNGAKVVLCARGEKDGLKLVEELNAKGIHSPSAIKQQSRMLQNFAEVKFRRTKYRQTSIGRVKPNLRVMSFMQFT